MIHQTASELIRLFHVHPLHERSFLLADPYFPKKGAVCTCGHPATSHTGRCNLNGSCGCLAFSEVVQTDDIRPFYQITHGPMESHALGRGLALARELGVPHIANLHCKNWCKNYTRIGAIRHPRSSLSIQVKNSNTERHLIYCDACAEDMCLSPQIGY
jgi:hypothetical protein